MLATSTKWKLSLGDRCFILLVDTVRHVLYCKGLLIAGLMKEFVRELQGDVQKFKSTIYFVWIFIVCILLIIGLFEMVTQHVHQ